MAKSNSSTVRPPTKINRQSMQPSALSKRKTLEPSREYADPSALQRKK